METKPYLIFKQNGLLCAIEASCVREIFFLPELTPIAGAPHDIVGAIDLRGAILPVMDLNLRFGYALQEYRLTDSVIVVKWQEFRLGMIVELVREVKNIPTDAITGHLSYGREEANISHYFVAGIARCEADIVTLLDVDRLIRYSPETAEALGSLSASNTEDATSEDTAAEILAQEIDAKLLVEDGKVFNKPHVFCPNATLEEKAIFRERADNLRLRGERENSTAINMPLAVVALNGEYFAINLAIVREFTNIRQVTPVPCTPDRIVGNMNLRGEIVTLVDIRNILNMEVTENSLSKSKAIVVEVAGFVAGIVVDEILDIVYLNLSELAPIPAALHLTNQEYLRGTALYGEKMMAVMNLEKLLTKGGAIVDEEV
ncbi:MAG: chemotaxis protein CheW [Oscillatoriaceae cyanobacterium Prado104]|jgi:purine-binding chemotaxis protein CheW|nr:chemotaxis protein CheW [Oscillatoriaceae cyanobacterium Prado104]